MQLIGSQREIRIQCFLWTVLSKPLEIDSYEIIKVNSFYCARVRTIWTGKEKKIGSGGSCADSRDEKYAAENEGLQQDDRCSGLRRTWARVMGEEEGEKYCGEK